LILPDLLTCLFVGQAGSVALGESAEGFKALPLGGAVFSKFDRINLSRIFLLVRCGFRYIFLTIQEPYFVQVLSRCFMFETLSADDKAVKITPLFRKIYVVFLIRC